MKEYKNRITDGRALEPGFLAFDILIKDERETFLSMLGAMHEDFDPADSSEYYEIELIVLCIILSLRAVKEENSNAVESLDRMIRLHTNNLRSGCPVTYQREKGHHPGTTPAEWAAAILNSVKKKEARERAGQSEYKIKDD